MKNHFKKISKKTTWCEKDFKCLSEKGCSDCKVTSSINGEIHFVKCKDEKCSYKMSYADGWICTCPIRKELYNKHGL